MSKPIVIRVLKDPTVAEIADAEARLEGAGYQIGYRFATPHCTIDLSALGVKGLDPFYRNTYVIVGVQP